MKSVRINRTEIFNQVQQALKLLEDPERRVGQMKYFKETIDSLGIPMPEVLKLTKAFWKQINGSSKDDIFKLCEALWKTGNFESSIIACHWSRKPNKFYVAEDMDIFESWVSRYVGNWASCDTFCNHTVAMLLEKYPGKITQLKTWARSKNRWMRRASAVSLIVPAKKGLFLDDILGIAKTLLRDPDDMVQKGYGWMLKVAWEAHPEEIQKFVFSHKTDMPRTALRYAIEKWPASLRKEAMQ